jgi:anti-anti-sigma factor
MINTLDCNVTTTINQIGAVVRVTGEIDVYTVSDFKLALDRALQNNDVVCIDLTNCEYMDASGFSTLIGCKKYADEYSQRIVLVVNHRIERTMKRLGLDVLFEIVTSADEMPVKAGVI